MNENNQNQTPQQPEQNQGYSNPYQYVDTQNPYQQQDYSQQYQNQAYSQTVYDQSQQGLINASNKTACCFAYLPALSWIMYLAKKEDKGVTACANQGFILFLILTFINLLNIVLGDIAFIGILTGFIASVGSIAVSVMTIIGIVNVTKYQVTKIPVIGEKIQIFK